MDWQLLLTLLCIGLAVTFVVRSILKGLMGKGKGCGSGCNKCTTPESEKHPTRISLPQI